jgi:ribosomal protein L1
MPAVMGIKPLGRILDLRFNAQPKTGTVTMDVAKLLRGKSW